MANITAKDLYSYLSKICPQEYSSLPRSSNDLTPFLNTTVEAAHNAIASIPPHPSLSDAPITDVQKLFKPVKPPSIPPGEMALWKLPAKDGKGTWFARKSIHEDVTFDKFKRALELEFCLEESGLSGSKGTEKQMVPGGGVESVRGIGCVQRVGEKLAQDGIGEMEVVRLAAQFPGPTAAREFVVLCCRKGGFDVEGGEGRWYMAVSRPVVPGQGGELQEVCPGRQEEGFIRGEYESVEFIRELVPKGEGVGETDVEEEVEEYTPGIGEGEVEQVPQTGTPETRDERGSKRHRKKHRIHHLHHKKDNSGDKDDIDTVEKAPSPENSSPASTSSSLDQFNPRRKEYPVEWVMLTRSDPGGNVPRWMVERGTPGGIVKDSEKFLNWVRGLSNEQLGIPTISEDTAVLQKDPDAEVCPTKVEKARSIPSLESESNQESNKEGAGLASSVLGLAAGVVNSTYFPNITNLFGTNESSNSTDANTSSPPRRPSLPPRISTDAASIQSFSTAVQHPNSPPLTPLSTTPSTTSSTISESAPPHNAPAAIAAAEAKPLSRLLNQKSRLLSRFEKALQRNRKGEDAEKKLRERYEAEVRREEERYKRDMEKVGRRREREAQKHKEKEQEREAKEREREEKEKEKEHRRKRGSSAASQVVKEAREVVERLTKENEKLARENEQLRSRLGLAVEACVEPMR